VRRRALISVAFLGGLLIAGVLCGAGLQRIGGLGRQHVQLERCILASRQAHPNEAARSALPHLEAEVPSCMELAGYEKDLADENCGPAMWQGDIFCYVPKSFLGRLVHRIEVSSKRNRPQDAGRIRSLREG